MGWMVYLICFLAAGCGPTNDSNTTTPVPVTRITAIPSMTSSLLMAATPTNTRWPSPTPSPTKTRPPTLTPLPTIPAEAAPELVQDLLQNNAGCRLPCWWGAIPGQTTWQEAERFLNSFQAEVSSRQGFHEVRVAVPEEVYSAGLGYILLYYWAPEDVIEQIDVMPAPSTTYQLPQVLVDYSLPTAVWISTYAGARDGTLPFRLLLFYPEQGISIQYIDHLADEVDYKISGCFQEEDSPPTLFLSSPEIALTPQEVLEVSHFDEGQFYLPLEEATGMEIETFYQIFKQSNGTNCLETPVELWTGY